MVETKPALPLTAVDKYSSPDPALLSAFNLSSTPNSKLLHPLMEDENITSNSRPNKPQNKKLFESDSEPVTESKSDEPVIESSVNMITESEPEKLEDESGSSGVGDTPAEIPKASSETPKASSETLEASSETPVASSVPPTPSEVISTPNLDVYESIEDLKMGDTVELGVGKSAKVRYLGKVNFADGLWAGLALNKAEGKSVSFLFYLLYFLEYIFVFLDYLEYFFVFSTT